MQMEMGSEVAAGLRTSGTCAGLAAGSLGLALLRANLPAAKLRCPADSWRWCY